MRSHILGFVSGLVLAAVVAVLSPSFVAQQEQAPQQLKSDQWVLESAIRSAASKILRLYTN
jgi:uncharacterized membrane-anchored protein YhcB (DUF1043 family)